jgi:uncharacterized membrane protein YdfJ with MMPL/SSD domain
VKLERLARLADRRPGHFVAVAVLIAVLAGVLGGSVTDRLEPYGAEDPVTETVKARKELERASGLEPVAGLVALVRSRKAVTSPETRAKVGRVARIIRTDRAVGRVITYYETQDPELVSRDRRATYVAALFNVLPDKAQQDAARRIEHRLRTQAGVELGGHATAQLQANEQVERDLRHAELLAFPLLLVLSLIFFRSLVAALLPLLVGALAIAGALLGLRLLSEAFSISIFALNLTIGLGLGLAIDYSLFMVSRYREELARSGPGAEALVRTMRTAGRTVFFSSTMVAAALASLLVFPQRFLYSMGIGGLLVTLVAMSVALLVLPGVLSLLGTRVNALAPRRLQRAAEREARPAEAGVWYRLSRFVMRRPALVAISSATLLVGLGLPFVGIKFTAIDATVLPADASARQVDDALKREFAPHRTTPLVLSVAAPAGRETRELAALLGRLPGVAAVRAPRTLSDRRRSQIEVISSSGALSDRSQRLVRKIRTLHGPVESKVTGETADFVDEKSSLARHLPLAFAAVIVATMVALFLMTGSVVLPLKALVMNVLTLSAAFGLLVLIFQDGRLEGLFGYTSQGALESTQPIFLFATAFGLSTDYGVFLLSRIKEARDSGVGDSEAVAVGLERTGRIVTAAALLFSVAIGAFATSEIIFIKELGVGTALAVLIDASIIRALLVPSLMKLLGRWNWWAPSALRRLHNRIGLGEGGGVPSPG